MKWLFVTAGDFLKGIMGNHELLAPAQNLKYTACGSTQKQYLSMASNLV